ncbi:hypothetical protein ACJ41O_008204 [Fusarium nematophilum]
MPPARAEASQKAETTNFEESLASKPFLFIIGEERKEFHVHKELIGQLSPVLNALVNGNMKEAREGRVEWPDLEVDTFVRFAKFAYSGDYTEAEPELLESEVSASDTRNAGEDGGEEPEPETIDLTGPEDDDSSSSVMYTFGSSDDMGNEVVGGYLPSSEESSDDDGDVSGSEDSSHQDPDSLSQQSISDSSEASSTLDNARSNAQRPINEQIDYINAPARDIYHRCPGFLLPYSIEVYMQSWERCLELARRHYLPHEANPRKRRRLGGDYASDYRGHIDKKYEAMRVFNNRLEGLVQSSLRAPSSWSPRNNWGASQCYRPVFLSHARLYILADKYGVEDLRKLALYRLHGTLFHFTVYWQRVPDLVALAQEIFDNTVESDEARNVIVDYLTCFIEHIRGSPELSEMLRKGGDFAAALVDRMAARM